MTEITCNEIWCKHNKQGKCTAEKIELELCNECHHPFLSNDCECFTFEKKEED